MSEWNTKLIFDSEPTRRVDLAKIPLKLTVLLVEIAKTKTIPSNYHKDFAKLLAMMT